MYQPEENILDAPFERTEEVVATSGDAALNRVDYFISCVLVMFSSLAAFGILIDEDGILVLFMSNFVLGAYQVLSGLIGAIRGNRHKAYYLAGAVAYCLVLFPLAELIDSTFRNNHEMYAYAVAIGLIPLGIAVYYTILCWRALQRSKGQVV